MNEKPKAEWVPSDPEDSWAKVELWRWEYGDLPYPGETRPMHVRTAIEKMADATQKGETNPANVAAVMRWLAKLIPPIDQPGTKNP